MSGPEFWQTGYGRQFLDAQLPRLIDALETIARQLTIRNTKHDDKVALLPKADARAMIVAADKALNDENSETDYDVLLVIRNELAEIVGDQPWAAKKDHEFDETDLALGGTKHGE